MSIIRVVGGRIVTKSTPLVLYIKNINFSYNISKYVGNNDGNNNYISRQNHDYHDYNGSKNYDSNNDHYSSDDSKLMMSDNYIGNVDDNINFTYSNFNKTGNDDYNYNNNSSSYQYMSSQKQYLRLSLGCWTARTKAVVLTENILWDNLDLNVLLPAESIQVRICTIIYVNIYMHMYLCVCICIYICIYDAYMHMHRNLYFKCAYTYTHKIKTHVLECTAL